MGVPHTKMFNVASPYDPAIPPLGIYSKELKAGSQRAISTPVFLSIEEGEAT